MAGLQIFDPDSYAGTDAQKIQQAVDAAAAVSGVVQINSSYTVDTQIDVDPQGGDTYMTVTVQGTGKFNQLTFTGTGSLFKVVNGKSVRFDNVQCVLSNANQTGFWTTTNPFVGQSTSQVQYTNCRVQFNSTSQTGFKVGSNSQGNNDVSFVSFYNCNCYKDPHGANAAEKVANAYSDNCTGWKFEGGNTLACWLYGCASTGCAYGFRTHDPTASGGSGTMFRDCGGSYTAVMFRTQAGFQTYIDGGRSEIMGAFIVDGLPKTAGNARGQVVIRNVIGDDFYPEQVSELEPNEVIGIRSASLVSISDCVFARGSGGVVVNESCIYLSSNSPRVSTLNTNNVFLLSKYNGGIEADITKVRPRHGQWLINGKPPSSAATA